MNNIELLKIANEEIKSLKDKIVKLEKENDTLKMSLNK